MAELITNLSDCIDPEADNDQDAIIVCGDGGETVHYTYGGVRRRVAEIAGSLSERSLEPGTPIGLLAGNHDEYIMAFLGIMRAGMVACPLNWKLNKETLAVMIEDVGIKLVFVDDEREDKLDQSIPRVTLKRDNPASANPTIEPQNNPTDTACIMFTSGSTGVPKAVPLTHSGYLWGLDCFKPQAENIRSARTLTAAPLYHMNAQCTALISLRYGGTIVLMRRFETDDMLSAIERHNITEVTGVPTMMSLMLKRLSGRMNADLSSVNHISMGSAPLSRKLYSEIKATFPGAKIDNGYGTTETGFVSFGPHPDPKKPTPPSSIGHPHPAVEVRLVGPNAPEQGVLEIKTGMMTKGYINRPDKTAERFVDGFYRTGDVMRRDRDGFHYFVEREDDMFVCGGENIYPAEVETLLEKHPQIRQSIVVPVPHEIKGEVPAAFVMSTSNDPLSEDDVKQFALSEGPAYAHPRHVFFVDAFPLGGTGKIDRKALTEMAERSISSA